MNDNYLSEIVLIKPGSDWYIKLINPVLDKEQNVVSAENFILASKSGKFFHTTLVENHIKGKDEKDIEFWSPISIEHGNGFKVGDIVLIFRKNPKGRWTIDCELEDAFVSEKEVIKAWRAKRSSLDNVIQAINRSVALIGQGYANPRRLGGHSIAQHYTTGGYSPQLVQRNEVLDVFDYVRGTDSLGQAVFLKALTHMPHEMALQIFEQIRNAPEQEEN